MTPSEKHLNKICTICGNNCSSIARIKDKAGRYYCKSCYDNACQSKKADKYNSVMRMTDSENNADRENVLPWDDNDSDNIPLDSDVYKNAVTECPGCGKFQPGNTVICTECGLNWQTGKKIGYMFSKSDKYEDSNSRELPDPEKRRREAMRKQNQMEYTKPLIMIIVGAGISCLFYTSTDGEISGGLYILGFMIQVVMATAAFWICSAIWIGFNAPFHLVGLRVAGIYAVTNLAGIIGGFIPVPCVGPLLVLAIYINMLMHFLELELIDAVMVAVITFIINIAITLGIMYLVTGAFEAL